MGGQRRKRGNSLIDDHEIPLREIDAEDAGGDLIAAAPELDGDVI
jgi:hypothetical protein